MIFEFQDSKTSLKLVILLGVLVIALSIFLNASNAVSGALAGYLNDMAYLIIICAVIKWVVPEAPLNFFGLGDSTFIIIMTTIGIVIGLMANAVTTAPNQTLILPVQAISLGNLTPFFTNVVAPLLEPIVFRGILTGVLAYVFGKGLANLLKNDNTEVLGVALGVLMAAAIFGIYHTNTYYTQTNQFLGTLTYIQYATLFGILFSIAVYSPQLLGAASVAVEIGWHFTNNLFSVGITGIEAYGTILTFLIFFWLLAWIAEKIPIGD